MLVTTLLTVVVSVNCFTCPTSSASRWPRTTSLHADPRGLIQQGMQEFREYDVKGSLDCFDRAEKADPRLTPYLWQRGISYYYLNQFEKGSRQFRDDVKVNPLDVEEIVWDIACQARSDPGAPFPPQNKLALPEGQKDRRRIMSTVYNLFRGDGATEADLRLAGHHDSNMSDEFYSLFYLGLYCEIRDEHEKARMYMKEAANTSYARLDSRDYMTACARVHCMERGWA